MDTQISMRCNSYVIITWSCLVLVMYKVKTPKDCHNNRSIPVNHRGMWQEILVCVTRDIYEISRRSMQCNSYIRKNLVMFGSGFMESKESQ